MYIYTLYILYIIYNCDLTYRAHKIMARISACISTHTQRICTTPIHNPPPSRPHTHEREGERDKRTERTHKRTSRAATSVFRMSTLAVRGDRMSSLLSPPPPLLSPPPLCVCVVIVCIGKTGLKSSRTEVNRPDSMRRLISLPPTYHTHPPTHPTHPPTPPTHTHRCCRSRSCCRCRWRRRRRMAGSRWRWIPGPSDANRRRGPLPVCCGDVLVGWLVDKSSIYR
jgi:hypothetical protein